MVPRQALAVLMLIAAFLTQPSVWLGFGILLAGYDVATHLTLPIIALIASMTDFGLGNLSALATSIVRVLLGYFIDIPVLIFIARSARAGNEPMPPPWYLATAGYLVVPSLIICGVLVLLSAALIAGFRNGAIQPFDLRPWVPLSDFVIQLALILPTTLAVARASGDRTTDIVRIVAVEDPPKAGWIIAAIALAIGVYALSTALAGMVGSTGLMSPGKFALRIFLAVFALAIATTVRFAIATTLYRSARVEPLRLGSLFE